MRIRTVLLFAITLLGIWFLYLESAILAPFVFAAVVAYILNPVIKVVASETKLPRTLLIAVLYIFLLGLLGWLGTLLTRQIFVEVQALGAESQLLIRNAESQISSFPIWTQTFLRDALISIRDAFAIEPAKILPIFSGAASRVFTIITFLFASFYFLKDGEKIVDEILLLLPKEYKFEAEVLLQRINVILGNYLRGQLMLVLFMATLGFIIFTSLGVKYSLILGLIIGLAEIIPMIGPIIAGAIVVFVAIFDGVSRFGLPPLTDGVLVLGAYVVLNQVENYVIVPQIMGKITKLHPLLVFFSVLAGGQLFGILGFILAVPVAASLRILFEYLLDKLNSSA